jgi:hypothetical protein
VHLRQRPLHFLPIPERAMTAASRWGFMYWCTRGLLAMIPRYHSANGAPSATGYTGDIIRILFIEWRAWPRRSVIGHVVHGFAGTPEEIELRFHRNTDQSQARTSRELVPTPFRGPGLGWSKLEFDG